jgi:hypothetical protein
MADNYRWERIQRLFDELRYELSRGMLEGEIDESVGFRFFVPVSKSIPDGFVLCEFRSRPVPRHCMMMEDIGAPPKLRVVK